MNKALKYGIIIFLVFLLSSIIVYCVVNIKTSVEVHNKQLEVNNGVIIDVQKAIDNGKWYDITEEDKITLAMTAETDIITKVKEYLKANKIAIFFVYGGPFDVNLNGNYIICTGFNDNGKSKILYPDDNFTQEWTYAFEGIIEFSTKVMLFEM